MKAHRLGWLGVVAALGVGVGCAASHDVPLEGDGGTAEPWREDPYGLVGVSPSDPRELLRSDFGVVRTVVRAEAPIGAYRLAPDGTRAVLFLDEGASSSLSALRVVNLRDGAPGSALRWDGDGDHPCASSDGWVSGAEWTAHGLLLMCDTAESETPALARVDERGRTTGLTLPAGCGFIGWSSDRSKVRLRCDGELWWMDMASGAVVQRIALDGLRALRGRSTPDGGILVLAEGDGVLGFVRVTAEGEQGALVPLPPDLDVATLTTSADGAWAFALHVDDTVTSTVFDIATGAPSAFSGCGDVANRVTSYSPFSVWAADAPRLVAACGNGLWLGSPLEGAPLRLGDAAYDADFGPDSERLLVQGAEGSTIVGLGGERLGPAWPTSPAPRAISWRRW